MIVFRFFYACKERVCILEEGSDLVTVGFFDLDASLRGVVNN